jgi:hypothetical protein
VLLVDKKAYDACDTSSPIDTFSSDGNTVLTFTRSGPYYFISGNKDNCNRDEKLIVVVMAERDNGTQPATGLAPSPNSHSRRSPRHRPTTASRRMLRRRRWQVLLARSRLLLEHCSTHLFHRSTFCSKWFVIM